MEEPDLIKQIKDAYLSYEFEKWRREKELKETKGDMYIEKQDREVKVS